MWGYAMAHGDRSVDVFVRKLRQKLERASPGWRYIHTHFGIGYRFEAEPPASAAASSVREVMPSLRYALRRWYSTVARRHEQRLGDLAVLLAGRPPARRSGARSA